MILQALLVLGLVLTFIGTLILIKISGDLIIKLPYKNPLIEVVSSILLSKINGKTVIWNLRKKQNTFIYVEQALFCFYSVHYLELLKNQLYLFKCFIVKKFNVVKNR